MSSFFNRWRGPLTLVSLGANLFLAGALIPHMFEPRLFGHHRPDGPLPGMMIHPRSLDELLPPADAALLREALGGENGVRTLEQQMRASWEETRTVLKAEPFDAAAFQATIDKVIAARRDFETTRQAAIVNAVAHMSPEGRQRLANLEAPFLMGPGVRHGPPPPPGGDFREPSCHDGPFREGPDDDRPPADAPR